MVGCRMAEGKVCGEDEIWREMSVEDVFEREIKFEEVIEKEVFV